MISPSSENNVASKIPTCSRNIFNWVINISSDTSDNDSDIVSEICLKSLHDNSENLCNFELIGDIDFYKKLSKDLNLDLSFQNICKREDFVTVKNISLDSEITFGMPNVSNSKYILDVLMTGSLGCLNKEYSALVTGPINKKIINDYGFEFSGHTEFLADISNTKNVVMLLANSKLKVALLTTHLPLSKVSESITSKKIIELSLIHI